MFKQPCFIWHRDSPGLACDLHSYSTCLPTVYMLAGLIGLKKKKQQQQFSTISKDNKTILFI